MSFASKIEAVDDLSCSAGKLEAILNTGRDDAPYTALVAHPHPLGGGTMHNKVVYHAMKAFNHFGLPVLRFNFRGTGLSEGSHDHGIGEQEDVRCGLDWLTARFGKPVLFAGFSFGSNVGMRVCCNDDRVPALVALGLPIEAEGRVYQYDFLSACVKPRLFLSGDHDPFGPVAEVEKVIAPLPEPKQMIWIPGGDHFFAATPDSPGSKLEQMREAMIHWLAGNVPGLEPA
ncbi:alpha/beta hydrolase [Terriglobus tenax]|uniref:alpha/beta hydrolase n=1 Tax=Terriglobus tenax TaxID=1111115 RepID=UPI0021E0FAAA|nr:alpha/beta family hydrolase [Terriglobus tenax]